MREDLGVSPRINYRKLAFATYEHFCAICGFGIKEVLEVAHLDCNRSNNDVTNLCILCPNCHKMLDLDIIPTKLVVLMRDRTKKANWSKRMKDAGQKAAATRTRNRRTSIAMKAVATRRKNERLAKAATA